MRKQQNISPNLLDQLRSVYVCWPSESSPAVRQQHVESVSWVNGFSSVWKCNTGWNCRRSSLQQCWNVDPQQCCEKKRETCRKWRNGGCVQERASEQRTGQSFGIRLNRSVTDGTDEELKGQRDEEGDRMTHRDDGASCRHTTSCHTSLRNGREVFPMWTFSFHQSVCTISQISGEIQHTDAADSTITMRSHVVF